MVTGERPAVGRSGQKEDIGTQVVAPSLTQLTPSTWNSWLYGNPITLETGTAMDNARFLLKKKN